MKILTRKALCLGCAFSLSTLLAACGPDDTDASNGDTHSLLDTMAPLDWPVGGMALNDGGYLYQNPTSIPASAPMMGYARESSGYTPAYDYGSAPYYEEGYYGDDPYYDDAGYYGDDPYYDDSYGYGEPYYGGYDEPYYDYGYADSGFYDSASSLDSLGLLALVALLGGVLDDSPPDYYFDYGRTRPWAWHTDRYVRYAEPIRSGYRYYYYEPGVARPFLVRDPSYSYGYRNDRLVAIYDRDGRMLDNRRAWKQRKAAIRHFNRARHLHQAARSRPHHRVSISHWNERKTVIMRDQRRWRKEYENRVAWRKWTNNREKAIRTRLPRKQTTKVAARQRSYMWRQAETPNFYKEARKAPLTRKVAENRQRMFRKAAAYRRQEAQVERRRDQAKERVRNRRAFDRTVTTEQRRIARNRGQEARQRANQNDRMTRRQAETQQVVRARRQAEARQKLRKQTETRRQQAQAEQRARVQRQAQQKAKTRREEARAERQAQARQQTRKQAEARRQKAHAEQRAQTQRQAQQKAKTRREEARAERQAQARQQAQRQAEARRQQARAEQRARTQRQAQQQAKARRQEARTQRQAQARRQDARRQTQARRQQVRAQRQERSQRNNNSQRTARAAFRDHKGR